MIRKFIWRKLLMIRKYWLTYKPTKSFMEGDKYSLLRPGASLESFAASFQKWSFFIVSFFSAHHNAKIMQDSIIWPESSHCPSLQKHDMFKSNFSWWNACMIYLLHIFVPPILWWCWWQLIFQSCIQAVDIDPYILKGKIWNGCYDCDV